MWTFHIYWIIINFKKYSKIKADRSVRSPPRAAPSDSSSPAILVFHLWLNLKWAKFLVRQKLELLCLFTPKATALNVYGKNVRFEKKQRSSRNYKNNNNNKLDKLTSDRSRNRTSVRDCLPTKDEVPSSSTGTSEWSALKMSCNETSFRNSFNADYSFGSIKMRQTLVKN